MSSCCAANHESIDIKWLDQNPGQLFNTPNLKQEREMMLSGHRVASCEDSCWKAEDAGLTSRRMQFASTARTHTNINSTPSVLNIILGSDCNMTCVYCCKQFSTAWFRDIKNNGVYFDEERFRINLADKAVEAIGQNKIKASSFYLKILDECKKFDQLKEIFISGGEPFLYNGLAELVNSFDCEIKIHTGLGVDNKRLSRVLDEISGKVTLIISAETTNDFYELVRYGNSFERLMSNLDTIQKKGIDCKFLSVLSNLTIFDFQNFQHRFKDQDINIQFCTDPDYLAVNVIDPVSKQKFLNSDFGIHTTHIHKSLANECSQLQKEKLSVYIKEFARRRNIDLSVYPDDFKSWASF